MTNIVPPNINQLQPYYQPDDEISLIDLWFILVKRKVVLISSILIALLGAIIFTWMTTPVFESRVVLQVGHVGGYGVLESPKILIQRLREKYKVGDNSEGSQPLPKIQDIKLEKGLEDVITITAQSHTAEEAQGVLNQVAQKILDDHQKISKEVLTQKHTVLNTLDTQIKETKDQLSVLNSRFNGLNDQHDLPLITALSQEKTNLLLTLPQLEKQRSELLISISELQTVPTRLLRNPTLSISAVKPKPVLYILMTLMLGIVFGVFAAFMLEFLAKAKAQMRQVDNYN
jgi:uncharacterized protein involved in exopolysaccharide biosynthesis